MRRIIRTARLLVVLGVSTTLASGCVFSRELASIQRDIQRANPELALRKNFVLNAGPGTLHTLESMAGWIDRQEAQFASAYLRDIDRVKIGIYDVRRRGDVDVPLNLLEADRFRREGWEYAVAVREPNETAYLMYRPGARTVRDLFVVSLSSDQLVLVRLEGNLQRLLANALSDRREFLQLAGIATHAEIKEE